MKKETNHLRIRALCEGALCVALAQILSFFKLFPDLINGGAITFAMFPICLYAVRWGLGRGLLAGFALGLLQLITDSAYAWGWQSMLLDYLVAYTPLGLAGLFGKTPNHKLGLTLGFLLGVAGRCFASFLSGVIFYAEYAPEGMNPAVYSIAYNGAYLLPECILCIGVGLLIAPRLVKELRKVK